MGCGTVGFCEDIKEEVMKYYFYPHGEKEFKEEAAGNFVRTLIFDEVTGDAITCFVRKVHKIWVQSCRNNIETDHRVKELKGDRYQVYSWVVKSKEDFNLPCFSAPK